MHGEGGREGGRKIFNDPCHLPTRKFCVEAGKKSKVTSALTALLPIGGHFVSLLGYRNTSAMMS